MSIPLFDIIIVSSNSLKYIQKCIYSLLRHTKLSSCRITVIDNASRDGAIQFLRSLKGKINLIESRKNLGFSRAFNIALGETKAPFIVAIDDDVEVIDNEWLEGLYSLMKSDRRIGIVGPKFLTPTGTIWCPQLAINSLIGYLEEEVDAGQRDYVKETDIVYGACWLMRRQLTKVVGFFDEKFYPCVYEDVDYCLRVRKAGYKIIYNGKASVIHNHLFRGKHMLLESREKFFKKWGQRALFPFEDTHQVDKYNFDAYLYLKMGRRDKAFKQFRKAVKLNRNFGIPKRLKKQWLSALPLGQILV